MKKISKFMVGIAAATAIAALASCGSKKSSSSKVYYSENISSDLLILNVNQKNSKIDNMILTSVYENCEVKPIYSKNKIEKALLTVFTAEDVETYIVEAGDKYQQIFDETYLKVSNDDVYIYSDGYEYSVQKSGKVKDSSLIDATKEKGKVFGYDFYYEDKKLYAEGIDSYAEFDFGDTFSISISDKNLANFKVNNQNKTTISLSKEDNKLVVSAFTNEEGQELQCELDEQGLVTSMSGYRITDFTKVLYNSRVFEYEGNKLAKSVEYSIDSDYGAMLEEALEYTYPEENIRTVTTYKDDYKKKSYVIETYNDLGILSGTETTNYGLYEKVSEELKEEYSIEVVDGCIKHTLNDYEKEDGEYKLESTTVKEVFDDKKVETYTNYITNEKEVTTRYYNERKDVIKKETVETNLTTNTSETTITDSEYDDSSRIISSVQYSLVDGNRVNIKEESYSYSSNTITEITTTYNSDGSFNRSAKYVKEYNDEGGILSYNAYRKSSEEADYVLYNSLAYKYDDARRLIEAKSSSKSSSETISREYDENNNLVKIVRETEGYKVEKYLTDGIISGEKYYRKNNDEWLLIEEVSNTSNSRISIEYSYSENEVSSTEKHEIIYDDFGIKLEENSYVLNKETNEYVLTEKSIKKYSDNHYLIEEEYIYDDLTYGEKTTYVYDSNNLLIERKYYEGSTNNYSLEREESYTYLDNHYVDVYIDIEYQNGFLDSKTKALYDYTNLVAKYYTLDVDTNEWVYSYDSYLKNTKK